MRECAQQFDEVADNKYKEQFNVQEGYMLVGAGGPVKRVHDHTLTYILPKGCDIKASVNSYDHLGTTANPMDSNPTPFTIRIDRVNGRWNNLSQQWVTKTPYYPSFLSTRRLIPLLSCRADPSVVRQNIESARSREIGRYYAPPKGTSSFKKYRGFSGKVLKYRIVMDKDVGKQVARLAAEARRRKPDRIFVYTIRDPDISNKRKLWRRNTSGQYIWEAKISALISRLMPRSKVKTIRVRSYFQPYAFSGLFKGPKRGTYIEKVYAPVKKTGVKQLGGLSTNYALRLELRRGKVVKFSYAEYGSAYSMQGIEIWTTEKLAKRVSELRRIRSNPLAAALQPSFLPLKPTADQITSLSYWLATPKDLLGNTKGNGWRWKWWQNLKLATKLSGSMKTFRRIRRLAGGPIVPLGKQLTISVRVYVSNRDPELVKEYIKKSWYVRMLLYAFNIGHVDVRVKQVSSLKRHITAKAEKRYLEALKRMK